MIRIYRDDSMLVIDLGEPFKMVWPHWFRVFGYGLNIKYPSNAPLFSEREGYNKPIIKIRNYRVFMLKPKD